MKRWLLIVSLSVASAACTLGPNYHRPVVAIPSAYRGAAEAAA